jgi:pSer/pThr/pTyr-binding forkhead associated (FHA) protein
MWRILESFFASDRHSVLTLWINGEEIRLVASETDHYLVGRGEGAQIRTPCYKREISSRHLLIRSRVVWGMWIWSILDLESTCGTRINGQKIETRTWVDIKNGDTISLGSSQEGRVRIRVL